MRITKRSAGIELLRILLMVMILILHINLQGGILRNTQFGSPEYFTSWFLESLCYGAVNGYAMITGYVSCENSFRYEKIIPIWLQVFFWNTLINTGFAIWCPEKSDIDFKAFFPVSNNSYWYFTAYFGMFFFIPFFNRLIENLDRKSFTILISTMFVLFSVYANSIVKEMDIFHLSKGYSVLWLSVLYFFGAYAKKYGALLKIKKRTLAVIGLLSALTSTCISVFNGTSAYGDVVDSECLLGHMMAYNSPFHIITASALLMIFKDINFKSEKANSIICFFSAGAFGVYLIHTHPLLFEHIIYDLFKPYADLSAPLMFISITGTAVIAYIVLAITEKARILLFDLLRVKENTFKATAKIKEIFLK